MSYRFPDSLLAGSGRNPSWSCSQAITKPVWRIQLLCVQWKTSDDGQRNCPKQVEFYSKNKFEKLVDLVGFILRIYHDARSPDRHISGRYVAVKATLMSKWPVRVFSSSFFSLLLGWYFETESWVNLHKDEMHVWHTHTTLPQRWR